MSVEGEQGSAVSLSILLLLLLLGQQKLFVVHKIKAFGGSDEHFGRFRDLFGEEVGQGVAIFRQFRIAKFNLGNIVAVSDSLVAVLINHRVFDMSGIKPARLGKVILKIILHPLVFLQAGVSDPGN